MADVGALHDALVDELNDVVRLLTETLNEEKAADKKLSALAESGINAAADFGMQEQ